MRQTTALLALFATTMLAACEDPPQKPLRPPVEPVGQSDSTQKPKPDTTQTQTQGQAGQTDGGTQGGVQQPVTPPAPQPEPPKEECSGAGASKIDPPPTDAERAKCNEYGGGSACQSNCWNLDFYNRVKAAVAGGQPQPNPQPATTTCRVSPNGLNLRQSPNGTILASMDNGDECTKLGEQDGWYRVKYQNIEGYAWGEYLNCN
jgi:hypothetical protein